MTRTARIAIWMGSLAIHIATISVLAWLMRRSAYYGHDLPAILFDAVWFGSSLGWSAFVLLPLIRQGGSWRLGGIALVAISTLVFLFAGFLASVKH
jgi:hypothetical protein